MSNSRMGVQASQNRIASEAPHPGLPRWKRVSALPSHPNSNRSPLGLSRWKRSLQTGAWPIRRQTGVPLGQAQRGRCFRAPVVVQKLAPTGTRPVEATPFLKGNAQFKTGRRTSALSTEAVLRPSTQHSSAPSPYPLPQSRRTRANYRCTSSNVRSGGEETVTGERETR